MKLFGWHYWAIVSVAVAAACKESNNPGQDEASAGEAGIGNRSGSGGTSQGGSANAGRSSGGTSSQDAGRGGSVGNEGGESGMTGAEGGTSAGGEESGGTTQGGSGNTGGSSTGGTSGAPQNEGGMGGEEDTGPLIRDDLTGPETDAIIEVDSSHMKGEGSVHSLFFDADGSIYAAGNQRPISNPDPFVGFLAKLDDSLDPVWTKDVLEGLGSGPGFGLQINHATSDADGGAYVVGKLAPNAGLVPNLPGETAAGGNDFVIGRYDADGDVVWMHQYGGATGEEALHVSVRGDGTTMVVGTCFGQLPGQPSTASGHPFAAIYDGDGMRESAIQVSETLYGAPWQGATSDADGNVFVSVLSGLLKVNAEGNALWFTSERPVGVDQPRDIAVSPSGNALCSFGQYLGESSVATNQLQCFDPETGMVRWVKNPGTRSEVIDSVEGVIWNGRFYGSTAIVVADDAIYIGGQYVNTYMYGSVARPQADTGFVARYTLQGEQAWFRQYRLVDDFDNRTPLIPAVLALGPDNQIGVVAHTQKWVVFKVDADNGDLL